VIVEDQMRIISPELVLVDEELAAWCRLRLREDAAAEEARRTEHPKIRPRVSMLEFVSHAEPKSVGVPMPRPTLVRLERVVVTAAFFLLAISGAASEPDKSRIPRSESGGPSIVVTWPRVRSARWYDVTVSRGSETIFRLDGLHETRLVLPRFRPNRKTDRLEVRAVLNASPRNQRTQIIVQGPLQP
jgi:hypothetical protein